MERKGEKRIDAVKFLHARYIGDDKEKLAALKEEHVNAEIARMIYDLRKEAGLSQKELADLIGTTQSVISRLEDSDYEGHSLSMLGKIAKNLNKKLEVKIDVKTEISDLRIVFRDLLRALRKKHELTIDELASKIDVEKQDLINMENKLNFKPNARTLYKLSQFYKIPEKALAILTGAITDIPQGVREKASCFAAKSESFSKLTKEEKKALDEYISFIREEVI